MVDPLLYEEAMICRPFLHVAAELVQTAKTEEKDGSYFADAEVVNDMLPIYETDNAIA